MVLIQFENLLKKTMGLDVASIGSASIERAVRQRLAACSLEDPQAYWETLVESESELQELVEAVVVPETWFFRHYESFTAFARMVRLEWLATHPQGVLRLLSLPCSTGEEPYSMSMALRDAGFPAERFRVDAVDISAAALAVARRAIYTGNAFRGKELLFRDRYFEQSGTGYRLTDDAVRQQVHFQQGNLFTEGFLPGAEIYDVIFCRNVLIYFDAAAQDRAVTVLERLLKAKGLLFVGPSETALLLRGNFVSARQPLAFAFRKAEARELKLDTVAVSPRRSRRHDAPAVPALKSVLPRRETPVAVPRQRRTVLPPTDPAVSLGDAIRLADEGRLSEAAALCREHLQAYGPSADALHLFGLLRDAGGDQAEAARYYRKALYLDPNHHEALTQLALLLERQGKKAEAVVLRNRTSGPKKGGGKLHG